MFYQWKTHEALTFHKKGHRRKNPARYPIHCCDEELYFLLRAEVQYLFHVGIPYLLWKISSAL
jgi:hypothetical protein